MRDHCAPCWWHVFLADLATKGIGADTLAVELSARVWPYRCEDFPDEEPETLMWLGCACYQRDDAGQVWCAR